MKKLTTLLLALAMALSVAACGGGTATTPPATGGETGGTGETQPPADDPTALSADLTFWTYPIGDWGKADVVDGLIAKFNQTYPNINVTVEYLDYTSGDDQVNTAIEGNEAPDLIMEGPERLVANWGAKGYMVDLSDLWDATDKSEVNAAVQSACFTSDGKCYEYPVVMTAHCMAINYDAFKEAGADQYVDLTTHTWTTEQFTNAVKALEAKFGGTVAAVYCSGQGGDQGTRALVNNLYGGTFTNAEHTAYTADSAENIKALEALKAMKGIKFDAGLNGGDEIQQFYKGNLKMAFCWNVVQQVNPAGANGDPGKTANGQTIEFMSFPSENGTDAKLQGGIWGFGIFDNGDANKIAAAKAFIQFFGDGEGTEDAVKAATYFPVRDTAGGKDISGIWNGNDIMNDYMVLMPLLGDYYQVTSGWATARTEWWNMLQRIGSGGDVATEVSTFVTNANAAASAG